MRYIALLSGGKDSCYNICCAHDEGHELVAAANLHPKDVDPVETDSWMFQTVGSNVVSSVAACLGVPLYRQALSGRPGEQNENEEHSDLERVLQTALDHHPEATAVSVGAIASSYQQIRVDRVCAKLGLTVLSYLWERNQSDLLAEMIYAGIDARIVKVAGFGLSKQHLGLSLAQAQNKLMKLHEDYGCHPCGEGGEFETICVDAPVFKKMLRIHNEQVHQHSSDDVYYLTFDVAIEDKEPKEMLRASAPKPPLICQRFRSLESKICEMPAFDIEDGPSGLRNPSLNPTVLEFSGSFSTVFGELADRIAAERFSLNQIYHVQIRLKNMQDFQVLNRYYNTVINWPEPPSRVAVEMRQDCEVKIALHLGSLSDYQRCVHVQGRSFWAPASIGPYSQARLVDGIGHLAGQIGLVPATLELCASPSDQLILSLQNAVRVAAALHNAVDETFESNWTTALATVYVTDANQVSFANKLWRSLSRKALLVTILAPSLPKGAVAEWVLKTCDDSTFANFVTETEEDDQFWRWPPVRAESWSWAGFHRFVVHETKPAITEGTVFLSAGAKSSDMNTSVWLNGNQKPTIWITAQYLGLR